MNLDNLGSSNDHLGIWNCIGEGSLKGPVFMLLYIFEKVHIAVMSLSLCYPVSTGWRPVTPALCSTSHMHQGWSACQQNTAEGKVGHFQDQVINDCGF